MIAEVAEEGWIATEPPVDVEERARSLLPEIRGNGPDAMFLLRDGGRTVGCAGLHATDEEGVGYVGMAILASHRGRRGGRALVDALTRRGREVGLERLELEVFDDNERAIALYESAGFADAGERRDYERRDGSTRTARVMSRPLAG